MYEKNILVLKHEFKSCCAAFWRASEAPGANPQQAAAQGDASETIEDAEVEILDKEEGN